MSEEFATAITLLAIGMITVFVVLWLVVLTGNILIRLVNRFATEQVTSLSGLDSKKIAAITAAVDVLTEGRGKITKIDKA